jgi:hypothetical protein
LLCASIGTVACGDSDALSSKQLIEQADAVCKEVNEQTTKLPTPTDIGTAATVISKTIAILEPAQMKLKRLEPPDDLADEYRAWISSTGAVVATAKQAEKAAKRNNAKALQRKLQQGVELNQLTGDLASKVGLKVCSTNSRS